MTSFKPDRKDTLLAVAGFMVAVIGVALLHGQYIAALPSLAGGTMVAAALFRSFK